jgi:2-polyprenyl-6-methoxyphenol hydroxylase-like FAD-dependent oxidoreductase
VGFGIAGGTAAFLLARAGHDITIFERAPTLGPVGAGILLQPSGQLVLHRLGMLDDVIRSSEPIRELLAYTHRGHVLTRLSYGEIGPGCTAFGVHRGTLFDVISNAVDGSSATTLLGTEIVNRRVQDGTVFALDVSGGEFGPFDFLLVADGSKSTLRTASGIDHRVHSYPYGAIWGVGPCKAVQQLLYQVVRNTQTLIGLLPIGGGDCTLFVSARPEEWNLIRNGGFQRWRDGVLNLCPQAEEVFEAIKSPDDLRFTDYRHVSMKSWYDDHTLFLGDAAHAMSPHVGQGVNLALIDAESFANALSSSSHYSEAFNIHEQSQRKHIGFYSRLTYLLSPFFQSGSITLGLGRDIGLPLMARAPWVRRRMACAMGGVSLGLFRHPMEIGELSDYFAEGEPSVVNAR